MNFYLSKPVSPDALRDILCKISGTSCHKSEQKIEEANTLPTQAPQAVEVVNIERVERIFGKKPDKLKKIVDALSQNVKTQLDLIESGIEKRDFKQVYAAAHTIKGSASNIGGDKLSQTANLLEKLATEQDLDNCKQKVAEISSNLENLIAELKAIYEAMISKK
jgi:HPt (histidine-containing phosphotransfer) domain-containing protein